VAAKRELYRIIRITAKAAKNWKFQSSRPMNAETVEMRGKVEKPTIKAILETIWKDGESYLGAFRLKDFSM